MLLSFHRTRKKTVALHTLWHLKYLFSIPTPIPIFLYLSSSVYSVAKVNLCPAPLFWMPQFLFLNKYTNYYIVYQLIISSELTGHAIATYLCIGRAVYAKTHPYTDMYLCLIIVTRFAKTVLMGTQAKTHYSPIFNGWMHKLIIQVCITAFILACFWDCQTFTSAQVVFKWLHLARPSRQPTGNHFMTCWWHLVKCLNMKIPCISVATHCPYM